MSQQPDQSLVQRAERVDVEATWRVSGPTTPSFFTAIKNVSQTGVLISDGGGGLLVGDVAYLHLPWIGEVPCKVIRRKHKAVALRFAIPVDVKRMLAGPEAD